MNVKNYKNQTAKRFNNYLFLFFLLTIPIISFSQEELKRHYVKMDKEIISNNYNRTKTQKITEVIKQENATWLRVFFKNINLGTHSTIKITSNLDGESQILNAETIKQWSNSSAYFNGDEITVTLYAAPQDSLVGFKIKEIGVGEKDLQNTNRSQCGSADNRTRSSDKAIGRIVPIGCTGWIISNGRIVTAGHCLTSSASIIEFNVPLSNSNRSINHPPVKDQYPINNFVTPYIAGQPATDWGVCRASANSQSNKTPIQEQGESFNVVQSTPGNTIRITGFGVDTGVDNQVQQTHTGPRVGLDNTFVRYTADTRGGNSGSPIIDEATGNAVGVHAYGGCQTNGSGSNFGERATIPAFWNAMGLGNSNNDDIASVSAPTSVQRGSNVSVNVNYSSSTNRDILVVFQLDQSPWTTYVSQKKDVSAGSGSLTFNLNIPSNTPIANNNYQFQTFITTNGGGWNQRLDNLNRNNVNVTNGSSSNDELSEGVYRFQNVSDNRSMDSDGLAIKLKNWTGNEDQKWGLVATSGGYYNIDSRHPGRGVLDTDGNGVLKGSNNQPIRFNDDTEWKPIKLSNGNYRFENRFSGRKYLRYNGNSSTIGYANTADARSEWKLTRISDLNGNEQALIESLEEDIDNPKISIYPNPATSNLNIRLLGLNNAAISILNIQGQLVGKYQTNNNQLSLDVSNWPSGVYFINAVNKTGSITLSNKLIVK